MRLIYAAVFFVLSVGSAGADDLADALGTSTGAVAGVIGNLSMAGLMWGIVFSSAGVFAFLYGKKKSNAAFIVIGILLTLYTFVVQETVPIVITGAALCGALYFFRRG